jgi:hypothetical protein
MRVTGRADQSDQPDQGAVRGSPARPQEAPRRRHLRDFAVRTPPPPCSWRKSVQPDRLTWRRTSVHLLPPLSVIYECLHATTKAVAEATAETQGARGGRRPPARLVIKVRPGTVSVHRFRQPDSHGDHPAICQPPCRYLAGSRSAAATSCCWSVFLDIVSMIDAVAGGHRRCTIAEAHRREAIGTGHRHPTPCGPVSDSAVRGPRARQESGRWRARGWGRPVRPPGARPPPQEGPAGAVLGVGVPPAIQFQILAARTMKGERGTKVSCPG